MASSSKNIFWLSVSRLSALVLLFFAYALLFRYLGPFGSGQYQFVLAFSTIFGVVVDFGIFQYIVKKISEDPSSVKKYFHNFLAAEVVLACLVYVIMVSMVALWQKESVVLYAVSVAGIGMVLSGCTMPFLAVLTAFGDLKRPALINFLNSVINAFVIFSAIYFHKYIVFLSINQILFGLVSIVLYVKFIKRHIKNPEIVKAVKSLDGKLLTKLLKAAIPFALLVGFSTIYNRIDVLLITEILGYEKTGLYTAAYKFFDLVSFFPAVVSHTLYPVFATIMSRGALVEARTLLEKYLRFMAAVALPMAVGGSILSPYIITIVAGQRYISAAPVLAVLIWAPAILFLYIPINAVIISQLTKYAVIVTAVNVVVNIVGNLILLPRIGIVGAAAMTVISELLQGLGYGFLIWKKITHFNILNPLLKPALASAVMGFCLFKIRGWQIITSMPEEGVLYFAALGLNLLTIVAVAATIYVAVLFLTGFIQNDDIAFIKRFFKKS